MKALEERESTPASLLQIAAYEGMKGTPSKQQLDALGSLTREVDMGYTTSFHAEDVVRLGDGPTKSGDMPRIGYTTGIADCIAVAVVSRKEAGVYAERTMVHFQGGAYTDEHLAALFKNAGPDARLIVGFGTNHNSKSSEEAWVGTLLKRASELDLRKPAEVISMETRAPGGGLQPGTLVVMPNGESGCMARD